MSFADKLKAVKEQSKSLLDDRERMDWADFKTYYGSEPVKIVDIELIKNAGTIKDKDGNEKKTDLFAIVIEGEENTFLWAAGQLKKDLEVVLKDEYKMNIDKMRKDIQESPLTVSITWSRTKFGNDMLKYNIL